MYKRGQVTVFVILGILIIAVLGVILYLYNQRTIDVVEKESEFDFSQSETIKNYVEGCIEKPGEEALDLIGKQGGEINPGFYLNWYNHKISYMCYTTEFTSCYNKKPFLLNYIQKEVDNYVKQKIISCLNNLDGLVKSKGYNVEKGNIIITTQILPYSTVITVDYPLTIISKTGAQIKENKFVKQFNLPLGRLINVAEDIIDGEIKSLQGYFTYQAYILSQNGEVEIERQTYASNEIYITKLRSNDYKFQFAIRNYVKQFP